MPSPHRATLLLAPSRTDGPIDRKSREKVLSLSLSKNQISSPLSVSAAYYRFLVFWRRRHYSMFVSYSLNFHLIPSMSSSLGFLTLCTISAIHFHPLSNLTTCVTRVHVIGDFCHITCLSNQFYGTRHPVPRKT